MLSQKTIDIVKSTAPILDEHGETLTRHFYNRMFSHNPEVAPFFNPANQVSGTQQRALAAAVCAYAANIDNLAVLGSAVELIAHKHASLMIKPEHYPIVGENLLSSIREVMGEGATDDVINAWGEAYGFLADILIGREKQIYDENADKAGGWEGFRDFMVDRKEKESSIITSLYLKPKDGGTLPSYRAGQYITVRMPTKDSSTTMRNYSLSDKPDQNYFRISVKREVGAKADTPSGYVSNSLHDEINVGDTVQIGPPCGEFFLNTDNQHERPLVLLAAGVGITPILSILQTALEDRPKSQIILIHGCLNQDVQPFKGMIDELSSKHKNLKIHYRYSNAQNGEDKAGENCSGGFVDAELIQNLVSSRNADYYFCGPKPFMVNIYRLLMDWGIPSDQIHFEFFGPKQDLERNAA
jgi:nitric oxide dioxygenase